MKTKKRIGTITFHSSYNHGSALQAYALQEYIRKKFGDEYDYEIINFRTKRQKDYYNQPFGFYDFKNLIRKLIYIRYRKQILNRKDKFEYFISEKLNTTREFEEMEELKTAGLNYDVCISGSDQIWNYDTLDFDWAFLLEFCNKNTKKISYAASCGSKKIQCQDPKTRKRLTEDLEDYSFISVREQGTIENLKGCLPAGGHDVDVNIDPVLLLDKKEWEKIIGERIIKKDYIFLYDLLGDQEAYKTASYLSKKYKMPIVKVRERAKSDIFYRRIIKKYDSGPLEFLNYIKNAKIVVSSSFHGNVFSILLEKPFLAIGGKTDNRIKNLLALFGLQSRAISSVAEAKEVDDVFRVDFSNNDEKLKKERRNTEKYFKKALKI